MKILLINPPTTHIVKSGISSFIDSFVADNPMPPLGLMYLAAYMEKCGHEVEIVDCVVEPYILNHRPIPDLIGITATTLNFYDALKITRIMDSLYDVPIVIGGPHCNIFPEETAKFDCFDYVVRGDGELQLSAIIDGECKFGVVEADLPNIDLDYYSFPARHLIDITKYHTAMSKHKLVTSMITSRGCPYSCSFCYQPHFGKKWRTRSAENVVEEMTEIVKMGIHEIEIYDDTFTYDTERVWRICELILHNNLKVDWSIRTRVDKVDLALLKIMARAGCKRINYGIESVVPSVLKTLRKGFAVEQIKDAIRWTKEAGIEIQAYFMLGSPNETESQMLTTIGFANKHIPDYCYYSITSPFPGTPLYKQGLKEGRYNDFWREFATNPTPDMKVRLWDEDNRVELAKIMEYGYKSFYGRPSYIAKQLCKIKSPSDLTNKAKIAVKMFAGG